MEYQVIYLNQAGVNLSVIFSNLNDAINYAQGMTQGIVLAIPGSNWNEYYYNQIKEQVLVSGKAIVSYDIKTLNQHIKANKIYIKSIAHE